MSEVKKAVEIELEPAKSIGQKRSFNELSQSVQPNTEKEKEIDYPQPPPSKKQKTSHKPPDRPIAPPFIPPPVHPHPHPHPPLISHPSPPSPAPAPVPSNPVKREIIDIDAGSTSLNAIEIQGT